MPLPHGEGDDPARPDMKRLLKGEMLIGKDSQYISAPLKQGDLYEKLYLPGGGGFGDPLDRDVKEVERDINLRFVSARAAQKLYGTVGATDADGEWKADPVRSQKLRTKMRKARLARAVPVKDWWSGERKRIIGGKIKGETATMHAECLKHSQEWTRIYHQFWALPKDFSFAAPSED
jgi:acetone carboxylase alpha subunit